MTPLRYTLAILATIFLTVPAPAQTQEWSRTLEGILPYEGTYGHGTPASLAVDDGNVYVATTQARPPSEGHAALLVKYGPDGTLLWMQTHDGPAGTQSGAHDYFFDLVLGNEGSVYVVGSETYEDPDGVLHPQMLVQRYDGATGDLQWTRTYNSFDEEETSFRNSDEATEVATDAQGNVYVAGTVNQEGLSFTSDDCVLIKYNPDGDRQWVHVFESDDAGVNRDRVVAMTLDDAGHVYLTGTTDPGFNTNYLTLKLDTDGNLLWDRVYDSPGTISNDSDAPVAVAVDAQGNVIVTGTITLPCADTCRDYLTVKYGVAGDTLWTARYDNGHGSLRNDDWAEALAVDAAGNIYVSGRSLQDDAPFFDYLTIAYDPGGSVLWARRYNGPVNEHDSAYAIVLDDGDNLYVSGTTGIGSGTSDSDYGTITYSPDGDSLGFLMKEPPTNGSHDYPTANAVDADGNLYVTGYQQLFDSANLITVKYAPAGTPAEPTPAASATRLLPPHPNPFGDRATIRYALPEPAHVRLTVYDVLGREIAVLVDERRPAGEQEATLDGRSLPAGLYLYRLTAGTAEAVGRIVRAR